MRNTTNKKSKEIQNTIKDVKGIDTAITEISGEMKNISSLINSTPVNDANKEYIEALKIEISGAGEELNRIKINLDPIKEVILSPNVTKKDCQSNNYQLMAIGYELAESMARYARAVDNYRHILDL